MDLDERSLENIGQQAVHHPMVSLALYCLYYWKWMAGGIVSAFVTRISRLIPPLIVATAIDRVIDAPGEPGLLSLFGLMPDLVVPADAVSARYALLFHLVLVAVLAYLIRAITRFTSRYWLQATAQKVQRDLRNETYDHMQNLSLSFYDQHESGAMMSVLNNDINRLEEFLNTELSQVVRVLTIVLGIGAVMLYMDPYLGALALIPVPLIGFASGRFLVWIDQKYRQIREIVSRINSRLANNLSGIKVIKSFTREDEESNRVSKQSNRYHDQQVDALKIRRAYFSFLRLTTGVSFVLILYVGGHRVIQGEITVGTLTLFFLLIRRLYGPMRRIGRTANKFQLAKSSAERVFGMLGIGSEINQPEDRKKPDTIDGQVEFDNVHFSYSENEPVLSGININIKSAETVGIVGKTGAGKSSLLKLIPRFYEVDQGSVCVDGTDVRELDLYQLRSAVGIVDQDPYLFSGTVVENIAYGNRELLQSVWGTSDNFADNNSGDSASTDQNVPPEITQAANHAEADQFIRGLPNGYLTQIGERGVKLSGGQRQRIAIARAIINDPAIIIFDEATSDVDTETENLIQRSLERICENRTAFLIAHRLSTLEMADRIIVMQNGRIFADGTHHELINRHELYAELWEAQRTES